MKAQLQSLFAAALVAAAVCALAQSSFRDLMDTASATMDAAREAREQSTADANIRAIFDKAKRSGTNFCGFYVGMEKSDATALVGYYGLLYGESSFEGDPLVYSIHFSLDGVRKIIKGGNSFDELCQGVANRVGDLKYVNDFLEGEKWEYRTIDGIVVKIREDKTVGTENLDKAFTMEDTTGKVKKESESLRQSRQAAVEQSFQNAPSSIQELPTMEILLPNDVSMRFRQLPNGIWFGETEVTQEQWESLMKGNPSSLKWPTRPVDSVSWRMCQQFVNRFGEQAKKDHSDLVFRLPNPEEWSYACKAGGTGDYCLAANGQEVTVETVGSVAWSEDNANDQTHPVGKKMANAWGLYDMLGNVAEWGPRDEMKNEEAFYSYGGSIIYDSRLTTARNTFSQEDSSSHWHGFRLCAVSKVAETKAKKERVEQQQQKDAAAIAALIDGMVAIPKRNYKIGKFEVTQAQWSAIMGNNPSERKGEDFPVENVTWNACQRFLQKLNARPETKSAGLVFRIPTAEEWWHACHAGSSEKQGEVTCYLEDGTLITKQSLENVGWMLKTGDYVGYGRYNTVGGKRILSSTHPVGQKPPNAFGLYDMFGNVREMVDTERGQVDRFAKGESYEHNQLCCGGSWKQYPKDHMYWEYDAEEPTASLDDVGFRLCADKPAKKISKTESVKKIIDNMVQIPGKNYEMGRYEVTQAQWEAVMGDNPSKFKDPENPVERVSWEDCQEFLRKLNKLPSVKKSGLTFRLPTEEEWEFACRAGATGDYCLFADVTEITEDTLGNIAWFENNSDGKPHSVGQKQTNAFGLYDMHGNVCEWTSTADGEDRVYRGGSWGNSSVRCMSSSRGRSSPFKRYQNLGFRLCASDKAD